MFFFKEVNFWDFFFFFLFFVFQMQALRMKFTHPLKQMFNRAGMGSEQKSRKWNLFASLSHSSVMKDKRAAVNL